MMVILWAVVLVIGLASLVPGNCAEQSFPVPQFSTHTQPTVFQPPNADCPQCGLRQEVLNFNRGSEQDPRELVQPGQKNTPYGAIGHILDNDRMTMGTGFLVGRCTVLTNIHVLNDAFTKEVTHQSKFRFAIQTKNFSKDETPDPKYIYANEATPSEWGSGGPRDDWAVLRLTPNSKGKCLGDYLGWIPIDETFLRPVAYLKKLLAMGHQFELAGFPVFAKGKAMMTHRNCAFANVETDDDYPVYRHFCSTNHGNSGSPIWYCEKPNQNCHVVAIHSSSDRAASWPGVDNITLVLREDFENVAEISNYATPLRAFRCAVARALAKGY
ncbi:MAG: trypsin-like peptidase domain-containing protein [Rhodospirillaceae bacterium]